MTSAVAPALAFALVLVAGSRLRPRPTRPGALAARPSSGLPLGSWLEHLRRADRSAPAPRPVAAWCDVLARHLRAGMTLRDALVTSVPDDAPTRRATESLRRQLERGQPISTAVAAIDAPGPHLDLALVVLTTVARVGGSAAPAIDRTASTLRRRAADSDERSAHAAQARLSAQVLTAVPLLMLSLLALTDDNTREALTTSAGLLCLGVGLVLNIAGTAWMRHMIRSAR